MAAEDEFTLHKIFTVDPLELKSFVGRYVQINLVQGLNLFGIIYTIDPVSQSFVLISESDKSVSVNIVLKNSINSIKVLPDIPNNLQVINDAYLFNNKKGKRSLCEMNKEKEKVKSWLLKNMVPVTEKGDDILVIDSLEIHPPYTVGSCYSSNSIVLDRIQSLLKLREDENEVLERKIIQQELVKNPN